MNPPFRSACKVLVFAVMLVPGDAQSEKLPFETAALRVPQVLVNGAGLKGLFDSIGESIVVGRDQVDVELLASSVSASSAYTIQIELLASSPGTTSGIYNGHDDSATLMPVFPAAATQQWFAAISFRSTPERAIVNVFDASATRVATTTYLGADRNAIGFYVTGPDGTFYSQDARNPGSAAQQLFFRGAFGAVLLAVEAQSVANGADTDHDDVVWYIESVNPCVHCEPRSYFTPTHRATWSQLKARFR